LRIKGGICRLSAYGRKRNLTPTNLMRIILFVAGETIRRRFEEIIQMTTAHEN
jgi:hypothetical protein